MKFAYKFSNLLGTIYKKGNVLFSADGNAVISPVGNRISVYDLKNNKSETLAIESSYNFSCVALSPNGYTLIGINEVGDASLFSIAGQVVLHKHGFRTEVKDIKFSPDGRHFAVAIGSDVIIYQNPNHITKEYTPFVQEKICRGVGDSSLCLAWSSDSRVIAVGSRDMCVKLYPVPWIKNFGIYTLGGHTDEIVACFFEEGKLNVYTLSRNCQLCIWNCSIGLQDLIEKNDIKDGEPDEEGKDVPGESEQETKKLSYKKVAKHFLRDALQKAQDVYLTAAAFHSKNSILVTGYSNGAFLLHELPDYNLIHSLSISNDSISSISFNLSGEWIALASSRTGQLIVWEWQSESFVLQQQGHFTPMNCLAYSPDGQNIATGGDDGKVKLWNASSGFSFVTFKEHQSCISSVCFTQNGKVVLSASLDGTVRAFDLHRYRNFRTFTSPHPTQFSCLAVDPSGEVICAGAQDTFEVFVWSMKTGHLVDILAAHEGPVSGISFSPTASILVTASWDKTVRIWDVFEKKGSREIINLTSDGLAVAFRPDGQEFAVSTLDGQILFFNPYTAVQTGSIEGKKDLDIGRRDTDVITAKKLAEGQAFLSLCYTADGECLLAGGRSKSILIYHIKEQILLKKFIISCNKSLDGINEVYNRKKMTEFGNLALLEERDSDKVQIKLPGAKKGDMASRAFKPEVRVSNLQFSPTGQAWAAATTEGLLIYSLNRSSLFDPFELTEEITPQNVRRILGEKDYGRALMMALHLNEIPLIVEVVESIPPDHVNLLVEGLPLKYVEKCLRFLGEHLEKTRHLEFYVTFIQLLLLNHGSKLKERSGPLLTTLCTLQKNLIRKVEDIGKICDHNKYLTRYLLDTGNLKRKAED